MYSQMASSKKNDNEDLVKNNNNFFDKSSPLPTLSTSLNAKPLLLPMAVEEKNEEDPNLSEYARLIGIEPEREKHLMWIAEEGFSATLPDEWKTVPTDDGDFYFVNRRTGQSSWEHPMDEHFRKMADQWRSNVSKPLSPASSNAKAGSRIMKFIPPSINIPTSSPTSPECPEQLSSGSEKEKVYSSDSGTFDSDDEPEVSSVHEDDEDNQKDYFYHSPRLDSNGKEESNGGGKRVTFSKNLVKVYEFDSENMQWIRSNLFRKDGSDPQPIREYLDGGSESDKDSAGDRPSTPRMIPTERYEKLRQVQKRADAIINRNWREFCNAVTESYARAYQLASTIPSRPSTTLQQI